MKSENALKLIHLANFNSTNIGNGALISGLESTISEDLPNVINWQREPWDNYTFGLVDFDQSFVDKINDSDGLIVGGAVTFNGRDYNNLTGSRFELPLELWSGIKKPVVFYGLSYRHWKGQTFHHVDKLRATIEKILLSDNMILSVRNDGTKKWIKDITGIDSESIFEIPDSAVFVESNDDNYYSELVTGAKNIIVSLNDEDAAYRFDVSNKNQGISAKPREYVVDEIVAALERLAKDYELNLILCPHYFDDYKMISSFIERISPRLAHQNMISTGLARVKDTGLFYGRYKKVDLSISMRVHSMSPCVGLGTPMLAYTTQDRMTNFMERIGLQSQVVNAFEASVRDKLYEQAKFSIENGAEVRQKFRQVRQSLRDDARLFHKKVYELLVN
jgi:polysaccharide pyruvyl transferase WcaK-like protein